MAAGLVARITDIFGIIPQLVKGHNGIYEVSINGQVVSTNQGKCAGVPSENEILSMVCKYISPLPGKEEMLKTNKGTLKGVISSYRNLDGLPIIETGTNVVIIKEFDTKPKIGEEIEYILTAMHGFIMYGKRVD